MIKKILFIMLMLCCCSGCLNIFRHIDSATITDVYEPTCTTWNYAVCVWWNNENKGKHPISTFWIEVTYLYWLVDFPCEVVFDTLTFPYDLYSKHKYENHLKSEMK